MPHGVALVARRPVPQGALEHREKIVADRIGHANMAYTLAIYTHRSAGKDQAAAENVAGVLLGGGWTCAGCGAAYIGAAPESGRCKACADDDGAAGVPVSA